MNAVPATRAEVCCVACAEAWHGDGEILANPIGTLPVIGGRLAKATVAPELVMTDGEALLVENILPIGVERPEKIVAGWNPYRTMFDVVWSGRRHVMMGASQIDKYGNTNIANIGPFKQPKAQLLGVRGGPGNTISHATSFFIPRSSATNITARCVLSRRPAPGSRHRSRLGWLPAQTPGPAPWSSRAPLYSDP